MAKAPLLALLVLLPAVLSGQRLTELGALELLDAVAQPTDRVMPVAATGSMYPFLNENCLTLVRKVPVQSIQNGDIVVYERDGELIGHRVVRQSGTRFIISGDRNRFADTPVDPRDIRGVVIAMAAFDPDAPRVLYVPIGIDATNRELLGLPTAPPFTMSEAQKMVQALLQPGEKAVTVRTTGDNLRRSEQCVLVVRSTTGRIEVGDLVTLKLSLLKRFFRLFENQKETTARRVARIGPTTVTVYREGQPNERSVVPRANIQGLVIGCVFFAGRDTEAGEAIYLE